MWLWWIITLDVLLALVAVGCFGRAIWHMGRASAFREAADGMRKLEAYQRLSKSHPEWLPK